MFTVGMLIRRWIHRKRPFGAHKERPKRVRSHLIMQLRHLLAGGKLATIINTQNLTTVHPRKVIFFRSDTNAPRYVHILSRHYESLQYPLLFPYGTPGWGYSSTFPFPERVREGDGSDLLSDEPRPDRPNGTPTTKICMRSR
jgi:hypothetical protein